MTVSTWWTMEHYAAAMVKRASRIVAAVHDGGPGELREAIDRALALSHPPGVRPVDALVTILAAAVNPDRTPAELWGWVAAPPMRGETPAVYAAYESEAA